MAQQAMFGAHVDEVTVFVGPSRDDGSREVFLAILADRRRHQVRHRAPDYVQTDSLVGAACMTVMEVENGTCRPHEIGVVLEAALTAAEADPF